jgi:hypothetical protein
LKSWVRKRKPVPKAEISSKGIISRRNLFLSIGDPRISRLSEVFCKKKQKRLNIHRKN